MTILRLPEGEYRHPRCLKCVQSPATKTYVMPDLRVIARRRRCGGELVDWSLLLQYRSVLGWKDVTRFSIAHANFHQVQSFWGTTRSRVTVMGLVNRVEDVRECYESATISTYSQLEIYLRLWRTE